MVIEHTSYGYNPFKFIENCLWTSTQVYLEECFMCVWKEYVSSSCWVECIKMSIRFILILCLLVLWITEAGVLKFLALIMNLFISPYMSVRVFFLEFWSSYFSCVDIGVCISSWRVDPFKCTVSSYYSW